MSPIFFREKLNLILFGSEKKGNFAEMSMLKNEIKSECEKVNKLKMSLKNLEKEYNRKGNITKIQRNHPHQRPKQQKFRKVSLKELR